MIRLACMQASSWLAARRAGLSAANALRLEEHLAHCPDCGSQARLLDGLRELSDELAQPLKPGARQRAILQALARAEVPLQPSAARRAWLAPSAFGALAGVAAFAVALLLHGTPSAPRDRVLDGELQLAGRALSSGATLGADSELATRDGARVALAHATLELRPGTRARWNRQTRELRLERGAVAADVDPTKHQSFSVATAQFRVLVLGTSFEVTPERVRVTRGRVRVVNASGATLATLAAGEHWQLPVAQPAAAKAPEPAPPAP
ncbi:MAG TPA: FecR family protein, partial [Polyangiales bacterium]|nr:FecR family protein [Polyangiales bacterium]